MTITYNPYYGKELKVGTVHKADIILHRDHLEVIAHYEFGEDDYVRFATLMPKANVVINRNELRPTENPDSDDVIEAVLIECAGTGPTHIKCATSKEANEIYQKIKKWMLV